MFSPFALVWAGSVFGRAVQQATYWSFRGRELVEAGLAQRREARRRRAETGHAAALIQAPSDAAKPAAAAGAAPSGGTAKVSLPEVQFVPGEAPAQSSPSGPRKPRRRKRKGGSARAAVDAALSPDVKSNNH